MRWCLACLTSMVLSAVVSVDAVAKIKLPDQTVISTLTVPVEPTPGNISGRSNLYMSTNELAKIDIVEGEYAETRLLLERELTAMMRKALPATVPFQVRIENSDVIKAYALPSRDIVFTVGMLEKLEQMQGIDGSEKREVYAFILAHELSHVWFSDRHEASKREDLLETLGDGISVAAQLVQLHNDIHVGQAVEECVRPDQTNPLDTLAASMMESEFLKASLYRYVQLPYEKEVETRADFLAADIMMASGLNPNQGAEALGAFPELDKEARKKQEKRLKTVEETMNEAMQELAACAPALLQTAMGGGDFKGQLEGYVKNKVVRAAADWIKNKISRKPVHLYDRPKERAKAVGNYTDQFYKAELAALGASSTDGSQGPSVLDTFRAEREIYRMIEQMIDANSKGDYKGAEKFLKMINARGTKGLPIEFFKEAAVTCVGLNDVKGAIRYLETASKMPNATRDVFEMLALRYMDDKQSDKAIATLDHGENVLDGDRSLFIVMRISLQYSLKNEEKVAALLAECEAFEDKKLLKNCKEAAGIEEEGLLDKVKDALPGNNLQNAPLFPTPMEPIPNP